MTRFSCRHNSTTSFLPTLFLSAIFLLFPLCMMSHAELQRPTAPPILGTPNNISSIKRFPAESGQVHSAPGVQKKISSKSAIIIDGTTGRILFAKSADTPRQPASTIKVLTGTIALKSLSGQEAVPVSKEAAGRPSSKMYLDPKRIYRAKELIDAVLMASANDASVALAELISGSEPDFAEIMTLQAQMWGATQTVCKTATGLTAKGQTSTARDLATIFRAAMQDSEFATIMKQRSMQTDEGNTLYNHNKALWQITGSQGGKTGYTRAARQTYVGKFKRGKSEIIIALMGSETMWFDLKYLVKYGFQQYQYVVPADSVVSPAVGLIADSSDETFPDTAPF